MRSVQSEIVFKNFRELGTCEHPAEVPDCSNDAPTKTSSSSCNFGDGKCGETLPGQHLVMDFTPDEDVDTEFSQEKCVAFWEFLQGIPAIQETMVLPDPKLTKQLEQPAEPQELAAVGDQLKLAPVRSKTAVSVLSSVQEKGLIERIFATKMPQSRCSLGSREYPLERAETKKRKQKTSTACKCGFCPPCIASTIYVQNLSSDMDKWDKAHPKNIDPPGHNPELKHCVMQRKVDNITYLPPASPAPQDSDSYCKCAENK